MSQSPVLVGILGAIAGITVLPVLRLVFNALTIRAEDETVILVTSFGRLVRQYKEAGLHFFPERILPWVKVVPVSLQRDFRHYRDIHVNDCRGTTVIIDLWIEFRIRDATKALFHVEDWERSLQSLLTHSATSILCTQEFKQILCNRTELGSTLQRDISAETARWGLEIENVFIRKVSLLPEVSRAMFGTVAARLERAKADVVEEGRLRVAMLEAQTAARVSQLVAEAKGQYPAAVGRAFDLLKKQPEVLQAYTELYELSLVRPHRMVSFQGFADNEVKAIEAAMVAPPMSDMVPHGSTPMIPALSSAQDQRLN